MNCEDGACEMLGWGLVKCGGGASEMWGWGV